MSESHNHHHGHSHAHGEHAHNHGEAEALEATNSEHWSKMAKEYEDPASTYMTQVWYYSLCARQAKAR